VDASNVEVARNAALPLFTVDYTYELFGQGSGFSSTFGNVGDSDQYIVNARAEIPIDNEARLSQLRRTVLQRVQRLATKDARALAIRQEVYNSVDNLDTAWQRILAARLESIFAARTYEAEVRQFEVGLRTSIEVLDAASRLGDAQSREVSALAGYEIALIDAAFATGTIVGGTRIRWDELEQRNPNSEPLTGDGGELVPVSAVRPSAAAAPAATASPVAPAPVPAAVPAPDAPAPAGGAEPAAR
jgi:outer membrane protein TolC